MNPAVKLCLKVPGEGAGFCPHLQALSVSTSLHPVERQLWAQPLRAAQAGLQPAQHPKPSKAEQIRVRQANRTGSHTLSLLAVSKGNHSKNFKAMRAHRADSPLSPLRCLWSPQQSQLQTLPGRCIQSPLPTFRSAPLSLGTHRPLPQSSTSLYQPGELSQHSPGMSGSFAGTRPLNFYFLS